MFELDDRNRLETFLNASKTAKVGPGILDLAIKAIVPTGFF
jgi:hypothetical protein